MADLSRSHALFGGAAWPSAGAYLFSSASDCLAFMFGPSEHDAHVQRWRTHRWLTAQLATYPARAAAVDALLEQWRDDFRARVAAEAPALRAACAAADVEFEERWALRMRERVEIVAAENARGRAS